MNLWEHTIGMQERPLEALGLEEGVQTMTQIDSLRIVLPRLLGNDVLHALHESRKFTNWVERDYKK